MRTIRIKLYKFNELSETAKQNAIEKFHDINTNYEWYDYIVDEFKSNKDFFDITNVYFSGFSSQGDGAMFEYEGINKDFVNTIIDSLSLPNWKKNILKHCAYVSGNGKQSGHYYHENSCNHNIYVESDNGAQNYTNIESLIDSIAPEIEDAIIEKYKELAKDLYRNLEKEYDYLTSEEAIKETIEANEYEFTVDGKLN
jgi:hypothetical protein